MRLALHAITSFSGRAILYDTFDTPKPLRRNDAFRQCIGDLNIALFGLSDLLLMSVQAFREHEQVL